MLIDMLFSKKQTINVTSCSSSAVGIVSKVSNAPGTKIASRTGANSWWLKVLVHFSCAGLLAQHTKYLMFSLAKGTQWNTRQLAGGLPALITAGPRAAGSQRDRLFREPNLRQCFSSAPAAQPADHILLYTDRTEMLFLFFRQKGTMSPLWVHLSTQVKKVFALDECFS